MREGEILLEAKRFRVVRLRHRTADGQEHVRDTVQHPGAVAIIPLVDPQHLCLIRNYRVAVDQVLWELPAGTLEAGEEARETARRELLEETGYVAAEIEPVCQFFMSPGILNERMHVFVARGLTPGRVHLEAGEQIEPRVVPWDEAIRMVLDGRVQDAKTVAALLVYERHHGQH